MDTLSSTAQASLAGPARAGEAMTAVSEGEKGTPVFETNEGKDKNNRPTLHVPFYTRSRFAPAPAGGDDKPPTSTARCKTAI